MVRPVMILCVLRVIVRIKKCYLIEYENIFFDSTKICVS